MRSPVLWLMFCLIPSAAIGDDRPNIVVILSDDMGYSDIAPFGGEIRTPTLTELAEGGLRFTQFYNTARCCPTRASLMTGLYPHQAGMGWMTQDLGYEGYRGDLNTRCRTIAEVLRSAGYSAYMTGKWHVTASTRPGTSPHNWPLRRGFERFYGTLDGAGSFYDPSSLMRDMQFISPFADPEYQPSTYYYTDAISDHAIRFIREHCNDSASGERPFFLYIAYTAAHWPMHALPEDIARYAGKYDGGYRPIREARLKRLREAGIVDPGWEMTPQAGDWEAVEFPKADAHRMEVYAAMIDRMDQGIGRIVQTLREQNRFENTLVFYLQDNGGCAEDVGWDSKSGISERPSTPTQPVISAEAFQGEAIPRQTRDGYPVRRVRPTLAGPADTYVAYGREWANVSNTPFREYKHWVHEGGISTPLIAHWPRGIRRAGELERAPGHLVDIMATCVEVSGAEYPKNVNGRAITPLAGTSLAPSFRGEDRERGPIFFEHEGNRAIRDGRWKLVAKENEPWELYDLQADRSEMHDLADQDPDRVARMVEQWEAWAERSQVMPLGAWHEFNQKKK